MHGKKFVSALVVFLLAFGISFASAHVMRLTSQAHAQDAVSVDVAPAAPAPAVSPPAAPSEVEVGKAVAVAVDKALAPIVPAVPVESTPDDIISATIKNVNDWKTGAWFAAVLGLVYVLVLVSKFKPIDEWLKAKKLKWIRPIIAAAFGGLAAAATALAAGQSPIAVILAGIMAGFGSAGFHEFLSVITSAKERERRSS